MKKIIYILIIAAAFVACSKDEGLVISTNPKDIIGNWKTTYSYFDSQYGEINFAKYNTYYYQEHPQLPTYITFLENVECGLIFWIENSSKQSYSYAIDGDNISNMRYCDPYGSGTLSPFQKWSIVNNKLILAYKNTLLKVTAYVVFEKLQ